MRLRRLAGMCAAVLVAGCVPGVSQPPPASTTPPSASADASPAGSSITGQVRVAAASDLRFAMDELITAWAGANPGVVVQPTYGSSGNFLAQIKEGAPFDVFFSADAEYPRELEKAGLAKTGSTRLYGIGQIVVWAQAESALDVESRGLEALTDPTVKTVAIANPEHAPYGRAAVAAMTTAGVYDAVRPKLVLGENVSQAAQFVESGNADAGVFALSLAIAPALKDEGRYGVVPIESYPKLEQGAVVIESTVNADAARAFLDFVLGPEGRAILDRYGFLLAPS